MPLSIKTTSNVFRSAVYLLLCRHFIVDLFIYFPRLLDAVKPLGMQAAVDSGNAHAIAQHSYADSHSAVGCTWQLMPPCVWRVGILHLAHCSGVGVTAAFSMQWRTNVYPRRLDHCPAYARRIQKNLRVHQPKDEKPTEPTHRPVNTKWICINKLLSSLFAVSRTADADN